MSWWLFDSYALPPAPATGGWRDGELVLTKTTERGRAEHRFGLDGDDLTYAIDITVGDTGPQPSSAAATGPSAATERPSASRGGAV